MTFKYYRALLWFDVGIKRYTTGIASGFVSAALWFDVGIKRYTTLVFQTSKLNSCGLM